MEEKKKSEEIEAAVIAAGIAILIAGAKNAVATLLEQWRSLVFLVLNLVVLTILFTSIRSNSNNKHLPSNREGESIDENSSNHKKKNKKSKRRCRWSEPLLDHALQSEETVNSDQENDDTCEPLLSKDELNAKAEAFILMFRQQLAIDAQKRRSSF